MWKITATHAVWSFAVLENFVNRKLVPMSLISNIFCTNNTCWYQVCMQ